MCSTLCLPKVHTFAESLGEENCENTRTGRKSSSPIKRAILKSSKTGYVFGFTKGRDQIILFLNNDLFITEAYILDPKNSSNKTAYWFPKLYKNSRLDIKKNGDFSFTISGERAYCSFRGKLTKK